MDENIHTGLVLKVFIPLYVVRNAYCSRPNLRGIGFYSDRL